MTNEQLKRANNIQEEIDELLSHKRFVEVSNVKIAWKWDGAHDYRGLNERFSPIPPATFKQIYLLALDQKIKDLEQEFESL